MIANLHISVGFYYISVKNYRRKSKFTGAGQHTHIFIKFSRFHLVFGKGVPFQIVNTSLNRISLVSNFSFFCDTAWRFQFPISDVQLRTDAIRENDTKYDMIQYNGHMRQIYFFWHIQKLWNSILPMTYLITAYIMFIWILILVYTLIDFVSCILLFGIAPLACARYSFGRGRTSIGEY